MARLAPDSQIQESIRNRRKQLRGQQRIKLLTGIWRTLAIASIAAAGLWATTLPEWIIRRPSQVVIRGNKLLSTQAIQALLPLSYPQSLLELHPQSMVSTLEMAVPISKTTITRQLFPPRLMVEVQERQPVAIGQCDRCTLVTPIPNVAAKVKPVSQGPADLWLIDSKGTAAPFTSYPSLQKSGAPTLKILGFFSPSALKEQKSASPSNLVQIDSTRKQQWEKLYTTLQRNPIKVSEIDWRSSNNLILQTELGTVYLGPYTGKLPQQLKALDEMRKLPQLISSRQITYIDLNNPEQPLVQVRDARKSQAGSPSLPR
ncbi:MAG: FtsQ-type POTRA domain-containing protein [Aphanocapsa sp. GSE-SYN-MK-11-07L]|jgi:cell division protein FtsQ|nr:FtsQ-type POTRA domain-containing protein [Aphanocapsa sp. GSE-SYN-MK-11-07L]